MEHTPVITLQDVCLTLPSEAGDVHVLRDITMAVNAGEVVSIVGPSGSGKTSLLMVVAGLEQATSGNINIMDRNITQWKEDALAQFRRDNIGIVFQSFHLIPTMNALENVAVPLELAGEKNAFGIAREVLSNVGLAGRLTHFPHQLSGGEQQRVALARAFAVKPKILLADEPTGNLDQENGRMVMELMFSLKRQYNTTLLLITHDSFLAGQCDRSMTMQDGKLAS